MVNTMSATMLDRNIKETGSQSMLKKRNKTSTVEQKNKILNDIFSAHANTDEREKKSYIVTKGYGSFSLFLL